MFFLAIRQLLSRKRQSLLILIGIILGTAAYIIISSIMLGFQQFIIDQLINNDAQIRISAPEEYINENEINNKMFHHDKIVDWFVQPSGRRDQSRLDNPYFWFKKLSSDRQVSAFSTQLIIQAILYKGKIRQAIKLIGTDPSAQLKVTTINHYMIAGQFSNIKDGGNRIILGAGLMQILGLHIDDNVFVSVGEHGATKFKIVGVFRLGIKQLDDSTAYADINDIQKINQTPNQISDFIVRLKKVSLANEIAENWSHLSDDKILSWDKSNANVLSVFTTQSLIRDFMVIAILLVGCFGIYNVLNAIINQKKQEIAILRALGFTPKEVRNLFSYQGLLIGVMGGIIGIILGFVACFLIQYIPFIPNEIGQYKYLMVSFSPEIYFYAFLLAFVSAIIASILPAKDASRMTPIDIIRGGTG